MAKVSSATIKLVLRTDKQLSDGTYQILLRCHFNGRKQVATGCSCTVKYWDAKNEMVKKSFPNAPVINAMINKMKKEAIDRRDEFELKGIAYTPEMVLRPREVLKVEDRNTFENLIERYTVNLSHGTKKVWKSFLNSFKGYTSIKTINEVDVDLIKGYGKYLEKNGMKESTIKMTISKLAALCRYAVEEGIINDNPFKRFNYGKVYKVTSSNVYIHPRTIDVMKEMFLSDVIEMNGDLWHYRDGVIEELMDRTSPLFARYFWLCMVLFQGLAPVDLCQLKIKDLVIKDIKGISYYCWDLKRQKTKMPVKIRIKVDDVYSAVMVKTFLMFHNGKYLLPVMDGIDDTDSSKVSKRINNWISNHVDKFRDWLKIVNSEIVNRNVENDGDIPLAPVDASFYSARHSFAQLYLSKGGNVLALATLLGRSMDTISTYVEQLTEDNDLSDAVGII